MCPSSPDVETNRMTRRLAASASIEHECFAVQELDHCHRVSAYYLIERNSILPGVSHALIFVGRQASTFSCDPQEKRIDLPAGKKLDNHALRPLKFQDRRAHFLTFRLGPDVRRQDVCCAQQPVCSEPGLQASPLSHW